VCINGSKSVIYQPGKQGTKAKLCVSISHINKLHMNLHQTTIKFDWTHNLWLYEQIWREMPPFEKSISRFILWSLYDFMVSCILLCAFSM